MTATVNASTSAGVIVTSDTSGALALQTANTTVATFNSTGVNAGIQVASFAEPTFRAVTNTTQSNLTFNTPVKLTVYGTVQWDTNSNFSSNRFTPTVAGYYLVNAGIQFGTLVGATLIYLYVYKNGSSYARVNNTATSYQYLNIVSFVYLNGSTDYIEIYGEVDAPSGTFSTYNDTTFGYFSSAMLRSA